MARKLSVNTASFGKLLFLVLVLLLNAALFSRLMWGSGSIYAWNALKEKQSELSQELAALNDTHLRLAAEYDNFRRRTAKEREGIYTYFN